MPTTQTSQSPVDVSGIVAPVDLAALLDDEAVAVLAAAARAQAADGGLKLLGSDGLLQGITKRIIEAALEAELTEHLAAGAQTGNERNGRRGKKIATEVGPMSVIVPRDRAGSFAPGVVRKSARRTSGIDEMVISLVGKGLTTGEFAAHLKEVFGVVIRMMSERELSFAVQVLGVPVESMSGTNALRVLKVNQYALVKTHTLPLHVGPITGTPVAPALPDFDPDHVITALRLVAGGSVSPGRPIRMRHPDDFDAPGGYSANHTGVALPDPSRTTIVYDPAQMDVVRTLIDLLGAPVLDADRVLRMALRRIVTAGGAAPPEDRLVDLLIAAEALLIQRRGVPRGPKKVPMAEGALEVLGGDPQFAGRQEHLRALVYCAYERRNHEMHADVEPAPLRWPAGRPTARPARTAVGHRLRHRRPLRQPPRRPATASRLHP